MTWRVQISGEKFDLEELSKSFANDDMRLVTEEGKYFLELKKFESISASDEVLKEAVAFLAVLSGVARLAYGARTPLTLDHVIYIRPDGGKVEFVTLTETLTLRDTISMTSITPDGCEATIPPLIPSSVG